MRNVAFQDTNADKAWRVRWVGRSMRLNDFTVLTFDCYGTLIDWETGISARLRKLAERAAEPVSAEELLTRHAELESAQQNASPGMPYPTLLAVVYKRIAEELSVPAQWTECLAYGSSVGDWPAFTDTAPSLGYLKTFHKLAVLSNVDNARFAESNAKFGVEFDAIYTAEDIGSYKPSPGNFEYMLSRLSRLGIGKGEILHVAESVFHDHVPARRFGLANCWINRRRGRDGYGAAAEPEEMPEFDFVFGSLAELVEAHRAERGGTDA